VDSSLGQVYFSGFFLSWFKHN